MRYVYPCTLHPEEPGGFYVSFPDVPGALTSGKDRDEAIEMAEDALIVMLCAYVDDNQDIPVPSAAVEGQVLVSLPPLVAAKLALYTAMRDQCITADDLAECLDLTQAAVQKLLTLDYGTHLTQVMKALRAVGRTLIIEDRAA